MRARSITLFVVFSLLCAAEARAYQALQGPTEVLLWDKARAFEGYTLFAAHGQTYLIDMQGNMVHRWTKVGTNPKLLEDGHLLDASKDDPSGFGGFVEVDWEGNVVWQYAEARKDYAPHHDFLRTFNKKLNAWTTMYIANRTITQQQALAVGADPKTGPYDGAQVDAVVEVDMAGKVVWEWWFLDHVIQAIDPGAANYVGNGKTIADHPGRLDVNLPGRPLRKDWLHCNSMDYNPDLDQVVVNAVGGEFVVIDHGGTFVAGDPAASIALAAGDKGDFLYRYGDPARYKQGDPPSIPLNWTTASSGHKQIGGAHDVHWIRAGLPGAGHFLVFNNGQYLFELTNQSYADEIAPFLDAGKKDTGHYVNPPAAGYTAWEPPRDTHKPKKSLSNQLFWRYGSLSPTGMQAHIGGSAQRLPNGNTLICADTEGHFVEVTAGDANTPPQVVWEYVSPVLKTGAVKVMSDALPMTNSVFRAYRYGPDDPLLKGRTLTGTGTITGNAPASPVDGGVGPACPPTPDAGTCECPPGGSASAGGCRTDGRRGDPIGGALLLALGALVLAARGRKS